MNTKNKISPSPNKGFDFQFIHEGIGPVEGDYSFRAEVGYVCWGKAQMAVYQAMRMFKKISFPAAALYLKSISPCVPSPEMMKPILLFEILLKKR
jgi:hypothetical protein